MSHSLGGLFSLSLCPPQSVLSAKIMAVKSQPTPVKTKSPCLIILLPIASSFPGRRRLAGCAAAVKELSLPLL